MKGVGARVWLSSPKGIKNCPSLFSYKLYVDCTNNVVEYEALILGLDILKRMKTKKVYIYGDLELVINQVNGVYQAKHPRLRYYRNLVLDLLENFKEYNIYVIPRNQNSIIDALDVTSININIPVYPNKKYEIEVKHRPTVPDNIKYWKVFEDDKQINMLLSLSEEFKNMVIDERNMFKQVDDSNTGLYIDGYLN